MMIVGLTGFKGSGKSTLARLILQNYPNSTITSFAEPMRLMLRTLLKYTGLSNEDIDVFFNQKKEEIIPELGASYRKLMVTLGTEWARKRINPDFWIKIWTSHAKMMINQFHNQLIIIDDVRHINEVEAIRELGGMIIQIINPSISPDLSHSSESEMLQINPDFHILNDKEPIDMYRAFLQIPLGEVTNA